MYNEAAKHEGLTKLNNILNLSGAWHPQLLPKLAHNLDRSGTLVIVHDHASDSLFRFSDALEYFWHIAIKWEGFRKLFWVMFGGAHPSIYKTWASAFDECGS